MPIQVAEHAGFCMGVSQAVEKALKTAIAAKKQGLQAFSLGELIHNTAAIQYLRDHGLKAVSTPDEAENALLIIRSHGASPQIIAECSVHAQKIVDCTCPFVHHVHQIVHDFSRDGSPVIILGDEGHPEIQGILGWCQGEKYVIQGALDIAALPDSAAEAMVVCQTTFPPSDWAAISGALLARFPGLHLENTIWQATSIRQKEAEKLAKVSDRMIVVGGRHSANTRKLAETCRKWCPETYLIESAADLAGRFMDPSREMIGITAGASTPAWSLKEVVDFMNDMEQNEQNRTQNPQEELPQEETTQGAAPVMPQEETLETTAEAQANQQEQQGELKAQASPETPDTAPEGSQEAATEQEAAPSQPDTQPEPQAEQAPVPAPRKLSFMEEVAASMSRIRPGQTITGKIIQITDDEVCVNIGYKSDGLLKLDELVDKDAGLGDEIDVEVVKVNDGDGNVILSQRNIVNRKVWNDLMVRHEAGELIDAVGKEAVKGGLLADMDGIRAFIPASHLAQRYVEKISQFVGQPMKLKIIEIDQGKKRVVASRKEALAIENEATKEAVWSKLEEGTVVTGVVRRFTSFGAFVDLGGVDGLIHVSDLSWSRSVAPSDILQTNQEVEVKILSLDRERERIALGYKQLQPRPWDNVEEKYPVGTILTRRIVRVRPFGAFVELEPGVDGLVHISQVALTRVDKIEDAVSPGQDVNVKVLAVDPVAKRISLSIREAIEDTAMNYAADIPGENAEASQQKQTFEPEAQEEQAVSEPEMGERSETTLEIAMRKAREELDTKQSQETEPEQTQEAADEAQAQEEDEKPAESSSTAE